MYARFVVEEGAAFAVQPACVRSTVNGSLAAAHFPFMTINGKPAELVAGGAFALTDLDESHLELTGTIPEVVDAPALGGYEPWVIDGRSGIDKNARICSLRTDVDGNNFSLAGVSGFGDTLGKSGKARQDELRIRALEYERLGSVGRWSHNDVMSQSIPSPVMNWLRGPGHPPIPAEWVPGASPAELSALNALGGITSHLLATTGLTKDVPLIQEWFDNAPQPPQDVLDMVLALVSGDGDAVLARLYSELVTSENRRQLGTFFTPVAEADYMIALWNDTYGVPGSVVDVGAGVGVFTASAATAWPDADIIAVDVNPVTLGLLGARLAAPQDGEENARIDRASLVLRDYTTWVAGDGYASLTGPRLILGNPPYTRASLLSASERERFQNATDGICGLRASLSTIITAISLKYLRSEDGLCLLLPAQWLESDYARGLRERLWALKRPIDLRLVAASLFHDAQVDAVVLMVGPEQTTPQKFAVRSWMAPEGRDLDREGPVPQNWRQLFPTAGEWIPDDEEESFCLQDVAVVRRGVATGANSFFVVTESQRKNVGLSRDLFLPMVKRLINVPDDLKDRAEGDADVMWMLSATITDRGNDPILDTYVTQGVKDGLAERHLCAKRKVWYDLGPELVRPDVIVGAMSRSVFRVVTNGPRAAITNNLFGWTWNSTLDNGRRESLVRWLRSAEGQSRLRRTARRGGDGLLKLEPRALGTMRIPLSVVE